MTAPRLAGLIVETADPVSIARMFGLLGFNATVLDELTAELRLDTGTIIQFRLGTSLTRIGLTFAVADLCNAALALNEHRIGWNVPGPNTVRVDRGPLTIDVNEGAPGLTAATLYVSDVVATAHLYAALGLPIADSDSDVGPANSADPVEPAADVELDSVALHLRGCGLRPATKAHMVIRGDPITAAQGLIELGWKFEMSEAEPALTTRTPGGCGVRVTPGRR